MPGGQVVELRRHKHAVLLVLLFIVLAITTINAQSDAERLHTDVLRTANVRQGHPCSNYIVEIRL